MKYLGEAMTIAIVLSYDRNQHLGMYGGAATTGRCTGPPGGALEVAIVERYGEWLSQSTLPKLFFIGEPGRILVAGRGREFARSWPKQQVVTVKGVHYLQEDSPVELGTALATFVKSVRA